MMNINDIMSDMVAVTNNKIQWIKTGRHRTLSDADVTIHVTGGTDKTKPTYQITLRNQTGLKFDSAIQIGAFKNRLYFKNDPNGLHVTVQAREGNRFHGYMKVRVSDDTKCLGSFIGDYELKESDTPGFYYIENPIVRG